MAGWDDGDEDSFNDDAYDEEDSWGDDDNKSNLLQKASPVKPTEWREATDSKQAYECFGPTQLKREVEKQVKDLAQTLNLSVDVAGQILRFARWRSDKLMEAFLVDPDAVLGEHGLNGEIPADQTWPPGSEQSVECPLCYDELPASEVYQLGCRHPVCKGCWRAYIGSHVKSGSGVSTIECPQHKCRFAVPDSVVQTLVPNDVFTRYNDFIVRDFVESQKKYKWCPSPGCESAICNHHLNLSAPAYTLCTCGNNFCFTCGEEAHEPITCDQLQEWRKKSEKESANASWIVTNTKKCPRCLRRIERDQGCNHMTCPACKYAFCWICMGPWSEHGNSTGGYYKCNKWNPKLANADVVERISIGAVIVLTSTVGKGKQKIKKGTRATVVKLLGDGKYGVELKDSSRKVHLQKKDIELAENKSKLSPAQRELDRYLWYYQRYANHQQSRDYAKRTWRELEKSIQNLHKTGKGSWTELQFLKEAFDQVMECRQILKHTYIFGFYLKDGPEKQLFEFLQEELERNTERMSEQMTEIENIQEMRENVTNFSRCTKQFAQKLLDGIKNGLQNR